MVLILPADNMAGSDLSTRRLWHWSSRLTLSAVALAGALLTGEMLARLFHLDQRIMTPVMFFQGADLPVHRVSTDPVLLYELAPNTTYAGDFAGRHYSVNIDAEGVRYPAHPIAKRPGVFRILCAGASTLYGAAVDDGETIPAVLERQLNATAPTGVRYETWNIGTSGYTLSQAARLATQRLAAIDPDLVLVQLPRRGRRAFLMPRSNNALDYPWADIVADPGLFEEQFTYFSPFPSGLESAVLGHSALARASIAALPGFQPSGECTRCTEMDRREARALSAAAERAGVAVLYWSIPANLARTSVRDVFDGFPAERFIDLYQPDREPAFYEVHPPGAILAEFGRLLADALRAGGWLDRAQPAGSP